MSACRHQPPCPPMVYTRWRCGFRDSVEMAVEAGTLSAEEGARFLRSYELPMSPPKRKAYRGERVPKKSGNLW